MKKIKILAVCGFGVGSSMVLRMKIDDLMKKHQIARPGVHRRCFYGGV